MVAVVTMKQSSFQPSSGGGMSMMGDLFQRYLYFNWKIHVFHLVGIICSMIVLQHLPLVVLDTLNTLLQVPFQIFGNRELSSFYAAQRYYIGFFQPLSSWSWFAHFSSLPINLELIPNLYHHYCKNDSSNNKTSDKSIYYKKILYGTLFALFTMSHVQGVIALWSHSLINIHDELQVTLLVYENFIMRFHVFSTGIIIVTMSLCVKVIDSITTKNTMNNNTTSGGKTNTTTTTSVAAFLMVLFCTIYFVAYNVYYDVWNFPTLQGRIMSTVSLLTVVFHPYLPTLFKGSWSLLALLPLLVPESDNDFGHGVGAAMLSIPITFMLLSFMMLTTTMSSSVQDDTSNTNNKTKTK